jgi:integrase
MEGLNDGHREGRTKGKDAMKGCRPLTEDEAAEVLKSFGGTYADRDKALFMLGTKSGFRISELLSLRLGDVLQAGRLVDRVTVRRQNMKKKVEGRTVLLHPDAKAALTIWIEQLKAAGYLTADAFVFQSRKGRNQPVGRVHAWRVLKDAYSVNGLTGKLGTHSMRKTFANRVYDKLNRDLVRTQRALGHRNVNSTVSYLSFREEDIDQAILAI